ncbi:DNA polymerase III subunit gamma and tau [Arthrobacter sp. G.S.26]|uniref:DNA polymerase III subunit gamma and tau n=1 Tax=Arthrobacter sp. G.S.26 TaxID=3433706 RepID=UPI003D775B94
MTVTTALYRRYRPDSFADVIGQEHVTEPLMTALRKNRVNHAYLFSGPRGCGKTTSARILARCLNCAKGPTDTPCGTCPSCVELARGGSGSLDVIEIDAASHGGVDDARDLRERATYAPVRDRYKIFIIDEAHMVTSAGFNALLKIVEEPPEHIKFIFATTEPDKVIGTIRSRTHHYPFRLVPPEPLMAYLELLCNQENVPVAPGVLSLVIRAGGGSVRDSLSVLDQLMAGAGPNGLDYELAVALLGYTHASLLDDVVEAVAASDSATVFRAVDRVIQTGHDPRRFVEDLLERFRDLIIVQAMPESAQTILRGMPADQIARLQNQAHNLGAAELSRAADVTNTALTEMTGATSPRLHLELLCARILLPSSEQNERGMAARIDRVERRLNYAGNDVGAAVTAGPDGTATAPAAGPSGSAPAAAAPRAAAATAPPATPGPAPSSTSLAGPSANSTPRATPPAATAPSAQTGQSAAQAGQPAAPDTNAGTAAPEPSSANPDEAEGATRQPLTPPRVSTADWPVEDAAGRRPQPAEASPASPSTNGTSAGSTRDADVPAGSGGAGSGDSAPTVSRSAPSGLGDVEVLRRAWPEVLQALSKIKRSTWALVEPNAQVSAFDGTILTLSFSTQGLAGAFGRADHAENLRQAIHKTLGIDCQITAVAGGGQSSSDPNPKAPAKATPPATPSTPAAASSADVAWGLAPAPAPGAEPAPTAAEVSAAAPVSTSAAAPVEEPATAGPDQAPATAADHTGPTGAAATGPAAPADSPAAGGSAGSASGLSGWPVTSQDLSRPDDTASTNQPTPADPTVTTGATAATATAAPEGPAGTAAAAQELPTGRTAAAATPVPESPQPVQQDTHGVAGDYSYSDDDWGPPRDEDAPPLEEEPPMDWAPPRQSTPPASAAAASSGSGTGRGRAPIADAPDRSQNKSSAQQSAQADSGTDPLARDPWARAVEQAPGVWVVGDTSNVGATAETSEPGSPGSGTSESGASAPGTWASGTSDPQPHYEPATASVPPSIPAGLPGTSSGPEWGAVTGSDPAPGQAPAPAPATEPASASARASASAPEAEPAPIPPAAPSAAAAPAVSERREPAYAMAAAAAAPTSTATAAQAQSPAAVETRQSLYQRLSNSPEAEAGRAKAPARAVATATYVQDVPSADDETIEESGVFGRAAVERILGGKLIEERSADGSPIAPRY